MSNSVIIKSVKLYTAKFEKIIALLLVFTMVNAMTVGINFGVGRVYAAGTRLVNNGTSGTVSFSGVASNTILAGSSTSWPQNTAVIATDVLSSGFDFYGMNGTGTSASIRSNIQSGSSTGSFMRFMGNSTSGGTIQHLDVRANRGIFDLNSLMLSTFQSGGATSFNVQALDSNFNLIGSPVTLSGITQNVWASLNVSANADFIGIGGIRITPNQGVQVNIDEISVSNPRDVVVATYTVSYDGNGSTGGTAPTDGASYTSGQTVTTANNTGSLVKAGYTFAGWNTASDGSGTNYTAGSGTFSITGNTTLHAKWTAVPTYTVSYDGNGSTGGTAPTDGASYTSGQTVTTASNTGSLVKAGYTFAGWNTASDGSGTNYTTGSGTFSITANTTLYAKWTAVPTYTVSYDGNGSTGGTAPTDGASYTSGQTVTTANNTGSLVKAGYTFAGWNTALDGNGTDYAAGSGTFSIIENTTLYAKWTAVPTYTVSYDGNGSTGGTAPTDGASYTSGQTVTTASNTGSLVKAGYTFAGWNTASDGSGTNYTAGSGTFSIIGNTTLYAKWTAIPTYTATLSETGTYTFTGETVGYTSISPQSITVNNTGTGSITGLAVALSGTNASNFTLGTLGATTVSTGSTTGFTIKPNDNLAAGTYTATVTLTGDNGISESFNVSFTVSAASTHTATLSQTGTDTFTGETVGYTSISPQSITVTNTGTGSITGLAAALSGTNASNFTLGTLGATTVSTGNTTSFTIKPNDNLAAGTYTATVTLTGGNGISESFDVSFTVNAAPTYTATLSQTGTDTFTGETVGYTSISPQSITVTNTGTGSITGLAAALSGTNASNFTLGTLGATTVSTGNTTSFTIKPNDNLVAGTYTATVTLTGGNGISESFDVSFTVNAAPTYTATLSQTGTDTFTGETVGYTSISPQSITVTNTGTGSITGLAVALSGTNASNFTLGTLGATTVSTGNTTSFTIKPNDNLAAGTYTATVTLIGGNGISESFDVSFTVNAAPTYTATLSQTGTDTFTGETVGYTSISPQSITVTNTGTGSITGLAAALSGTNASNFTLGTLGATTVSTGNTISFTIRPNDGLVAGTYTATVTLTGDNGISKSFDVSFTVSTAPVAPSVTTDPSNKTVTAGETTSFTVSANGTNLTYQWQVDKGTGSGFENVSDGGVYSGATTATLNITEATESMDSYKYRAVVSGTVSPSATSNSATLIVNPAPAAPSITTQPDDETVSEGNSANFTVVATGDAPLSYQWKKDGVDLIGKTSSMLSLSNVQKLDEGSYRVVIINSAGSIASDEAILTVTTSAAVTYTLNYEAEAGGTITGESSQMVNEGDNGSTVTAVADKGYHFVNWSDGKTSASRRDTNVSKDIDVKAIFEVDLSIYTNNTNRSKNYRN